MSQSHLYLVRVWSLREAFRADVREVSSEETQVFGSHDELARFFLERGASTPTAPVPPVPTQRAD